MPAVIATETVNGYQVYRSRQEDLIHPLSGLQAESLWLTLGGLLGFLVDVGYNSLIVVDHRRLDIHGGPAILLVANHYSFASHIP